jgi:hypothetical protein
MILKQFPNLEVMIFCYIFLEDFFQWRADTAYQDGTVCSETSAYKIQTPGNNQNERIQHSQHGDSLKSRITVICKIIEILY